MSKDDIMKIVSIHIEKLIEEKEKENYTEVCGKDEVEDNIQFHQKLTCIMMSRKKDGILRFKWSFNESALHKGNDVLLYGSNLQRYYKAFIMLKEKDELYL